MLNAGIQPHVTLFHGDLPPSLEDEYGGWLDKKILYSFLDMVSIRIERYGVRYKCEVTSTNL